MTVFGISAAKLEIESYHDFRTEKVPYSCIKFRTIFYLGLAMSVGLHHYRLCHELLPLDERRKSSFVSRQINRTA